MDHNLHPFPLLTPSRIRILLVPVAPITKDVFRQYVDLISQFSVVSIQDASPPPTSSAAPSSSSAPKFTDKLFNHPGHVYLNFTTSHNKDHASLEDFQLHRQVMGVVGVMHLKHSSGSGSGSGNGLVEGGKRFQGIVQKYPSCLVSRCFAFEPPEGFAPEPKELRGIEVVPNEGQLSFYLQKLVNGFTTDLLMAFGALAHQIEQRPVILGPSMTLSTPPITAPSTAATAASTPSLTVPPQVASSTLSQTLPTPTAAAAPIDPPSSGAFGGLGSLLLTDKNKKRTPGRSQKLMGDLYLLAGRTDLAMSTYAGAVELMKQTGDCYWQGAALEGFQAAMALSLIQKAGLGKPDSRTQKILAPPSLTSILTTDLESTQLKSFLLESADKFREILSLYERGNAASINTHQGFCPLLGVQACIRIARLLAGMWRYGFGGTVVGGAGVPLHSTDGKSAVAELSFGPNASSIVPGANTAPAAPVEKITLTNGLGGVSRLDVSSWLIRARSTPGFESMSLVDKV
ncbi:hypothetical protein HDV05_008038, partial [Chytridiales sp. JEL 0842]